MTRQLRVWASLLAITLVLAGCKTLVSKWPGKQEPSTVQIIRAQDAGLPPPGAKTTEIAAQPALPWLQPRTGEPAAPPVESARLPPPAPSGQGQQPARPNVTVDPGALPPPREGEQPGGLPEGALAALLGRPSATPDLAAQMPGKKTVALMLPLSGPNQALGQAMLDAAMLATFDMADEDFLLRPYDTGGTPEGAAAAVRAVLTDGAGIVLGPLFGAEAREVGRAAVPEGLSVLTFSNDRLVAGNGINIMGFLPEAQVIRVIGYARQRRIERFAVMAPNNEYGQAIVNGARLALDAYGGQLVDVAMYDAGAEDLTPVVRRLARDEGGRRAAVAQLQGKNDPASKEALRRLQDQISESLGYDALLIAESGQRLRALAPLLPYYDIDPSKVKFLGTSLWSGDPNLGNEPAMVGAWYAAPPPLSHTDFEKRYESTYKRRPPRLASLAYDATALAAVLAKSPGFRREAIVAPSGYAGVDGIFRFREDGIIERGMAVIEVQPRGIKVVDPAPDTFQAN